MSLLVQVTEISLDYRTRRSETVGTKVRLGMEYIDTLLVDRSWKLLTAWYTNNYSESVY